VGHAKVQADIDNLTAALAGLRVEEAFIPAIAPSNVEGRQRNAHYKTDEEYRAIVDAGFLLQIDDPRLVTSWDRACTTWSSRTSSTSS
jgi:5-methyltetrahydropteroyltriglutamate--homocysteine methyltransferase